MSTAPLASAAPLAYLLHPGVLIIRHGDAPAIEGGTDEERALSDEGRAQCLRARMGHLAPFIAEMKLVWVPKGIRRFAESADALLPGRYPIDIPELYLQHAGIPQLEAREAAAREIGNVPLTRYYERGLEPALRQYAQGVLDAVLFSVQGYPAQQPSPIIASYTYGPQIALELARGFLESQPGLLETAERMILEATLPPTGAIFIQPTGVTLLMPLSE